MGFRITTNMMMNSYRYNLQNSTLKLSNARDQVLTGRQFNSYAEDPAAATQAFRLRRTYYQSYSQLSSTKNVYSKFNTAWHNLTGVKDKLINKSAIESAIRGENGGTGEARKALATVLREDAKSLIHSLNQKLGDQFIFAGNDGLNVPFEWKGQDLYYRGINVNAGSVQPPFKEAPTWLDDVRNANYGTDAWTDEDEAWFSYYTHRTDKKPDSAEPSWLDDGATDPNGDDGATVNDEEKAWMAYYRHEVKTPPVEDEPTWKTDAATKDCFDSYGMPDVEKLKAAGINVDDDVNKGWIEYYKDQSNLEKLKAMSGDELYIDLGMGLAESSPNNPINGSYFNSALNGITFTDFGVDQDGDPKNLAMIMVELADLFQAWDETKEPQGYNPELAGPSSVDPVTGQKLTSTQMEEKAFRLLNKLKASDEHFTEKLVELDARSTFLQTNEERLSTLLTDTNVQILDIEQVDLADAITTFSWQQYCYNAALKIGNQLLSQSLIDYMN